MVIKIFMVIITENRQFIVFLLSAKWEEGQFMVVLDSEGRMISMKNKVSFILHIVMKGNLVIVVTKCMT